MFKVKDLKVGDRVKFNKTSVVVRGTKSDKVYVSKQETGLYIFSIPVYSDNHDDLFNRVELCESN